MPLYATSEKRQSNLFVHSQYGCEVSKDMSYDCGVELSPDGQYGRPDYLERADHGPLSLHSFYLVLWANLSSLCMSLITAPQGLTDSVCIISPENQNQSGFCLQQLRDVWRLMRENMKLSLEEQSFFVMRCMHKLLDVSWSYKVLQWNL